ncbi:hypothetical protein AB1Y20_004055 [Prymnesium parvum]|uniref:Peptidylamidoglycolate lyase n=1 Tax=Prymnesium parvum TaxID=97485 RepID=A0AB34J947_PRYPA|mmetsp:Transcript_27145/g.40995  ORF Transcript_27145/g.40995 Transcript_27145/m.40995 type:complete len:392 (+) Transcript_27145:44-1219(+)
MPTAPESRLASIAPLVAKRPASDAGSCPASTTCEVGSVGERNVRVKWVSNSAYVANEVLGSLDLLLLLMDHMNAVSISDAARVSRAWREAAAIKENQWRILKPSHTISPADGESHSLYSEFVATLPEVCGHATRLIVSDTHNNRLQCLDRDGLQKARYGRHGFMPGCFSKPRGLVCDDVGVFVVDSGNRRVQKLPLPKDGDWSGEPLAVSIGTGGEALRGPMGIALDRERVFVSDTYNHRIVAYDRHTLAFLFAFGRRGARPGEFNCPCGIAAHEKRLYIADNGNSRVQVFSVDGVFLHVLGAKLGASAVLFKAPYGVAVAAGRLIVSENTEGRLQVLELEGRPLQILTPQGVGVSREASFWLYGLCANAERAYVTDGCNGNVHVLDVRQS